MMGLNMNNRKRGDRPGKLSCHWKGGRILTTYGYIMCWVMDPKYSILKSGYMFEHRYNMEKALRRKLLKTESVHHIDYNPLNNQIKNLFLCTHSENVRLNKTVFNLIPELLKQKIIRFSRKQRKYILS